MKNAWRSVVWVILLGCSVSVAGPITTGTVVREMVDLVRLGDLPDPFYHTVQFSSYDHRSTVPGGPDWFANSDGFGGEPVPNFEAVLEEQPDEDTPGKYLICDVKGPGVLVRQWTARIAGSLAVYLDDAAEPVWEGPATEFLQRPWDAYLDAAGLEPALLAGTFYQREAAYCPFPFAERLRIVYTGKLKEIHFYQVQVRTYDKGAEVETFRPEDLKTYADDIRRTARILRAPEAEWPYESEQAPLPFEVTVDEFRVVSALTLEGPAALERLTIEVEAENLRRALRQTILRIHFDGHPDAQVQAPIGDFFGAAPGVNPYDSAPFTVEPSGRMTCRFVMPFARGMDLQFENLSVDSVTVRGEAVPRDYDWNDDTSMHFRARWRIAHDLHASGARVQDLPFLCAKGSGVYVGSVSYVLNPNDVPSPGGNWWGEGDEKIFVDGDVRPSTFGTGSEDYYNYAWSSPDIFVFPYCGQPRNDGPANRGFVTNNRWHIVDPLPFREGLSFYMEFFPHEYNRGMAYGRIGYHYGRPGITDDHLAATREDVRTQPLPANWHPAARGGAKNSVFHETETVVTGNPASRMDANRLYTGGHCFVWQPVEKGETLELEVPVDETGAYVIRFCAAVRPGSGAFSAQVNGHDAGLDRVDLQNPYRTMLRCFSTKGLKLEKGPNTITLTLEGGEEGAEIGLDFIWLQQR